MFPAVKNVTGDDEQEILAAPRERPVEREDKREKNEVGERMKNHG